MDRLKGKRAIVTGAASGIGLAAANLFAQEGATVIATDINPAVQDVAASPAGGGKIVSMVGDAADESFVREVIRSAEADFGGLDIFFANAGISGPRLNLFEQEVTDWNEVLRVDLISVALAIKYSAMAMMRGRGGSIVCTSSIAGMVAYGLAPYAAAKAGVIALVRNASHELGSSNIRVNAIAPGVTESNLTRHHYDRFRETGEASAVLRLSSLGRGGSALELAQAALFLASDEASFVHGHTLVVDGGWTARAPQPEGGGILERPHLPNQPTDA